MLFFFFYLPAASISTMRVGLVFFVLSGMAVTIFAQPPPRRPFSTFFDRLRAMPAALGFRRPSSFNRPAPPLPFCANGTRALCSPGSGCSCSDGSIPTRSRRVPSAPVVPQFSRPAGFSRPRQPLFSLPTLFTVG